MVRQNQELEACWSCGAPGQAIAGKSWTRECKGCDVTWEGAPFGTRVRDSLWQRGRALDSIAMHWGLENRDGYLDHGTVKLSSPA
jgi:hypothetical protein